MLTIKVYLLVVATTSLMSLVRLQPMVISPPKWLRSLKRREKAAAVWAPRSASHRLIAWTRLSTQIPWGRKTFPSIGVTLRTSTWTRKDRLCRSHSRGNLGSNRLPRSSSTLSIPKTRLLARSANHRNTRSCSRTRCLTKLEGARLNLPTMLRERLA